MDSIILESQIKVPENSKLVGRTNGQIKRDFGITILHKHNPYPASSTCVICSQVDYRLESDKFISFSGNRENILKFVNALLEGC